MREVIEVLEENKIRKIVEFHVGWNNIDKKSEHLIKSLINGKEITNKNDLLELEMWGFIQVKR